MKKILQGSNVGALIITIIVNYVSSSGLLNGTTIAELSDKYHTLFTPADYAFSIWGLIYLMLAGFVIYQATGASSKSANGDFVRQIGWWFVISCLANCLWIITWVYELTGLSVLMMLILLGSVLNIVINTNMERWDAPLPEIVFLWWPFCFYAGWITLATIANISAYLVKLGWGGFGLAETSWPIIVVLIAGALNAYMIWNRNMREFAVVGIWGLIAVAIPNIGLHPAIVWTAAIVSVLLLFNIAIHGYQNSATSPYVKWRQMRSS